MWGIREEPRHSVDFCLVELHGWWMVMPFTGEDGEKHVLKWKNLSTFCFHHVNFESLNIRPLSPNGTYVNLKYFSSHLNLEHLLKPMKTIS